jgi:hypothetical protein
VSFVVMVSLAANAKGTEHKKHKEEHKKGKNPLAK